jgi:hypothetical protein
MASNDNTSKHKLEEEAESSALRKRLRLSDDDGGDDDSFDSLEEEIEEEDMEEEVSSEESSMNQFDTFEEKLLAKRSRSFFFSDNGDTTSPSLEPRTPEMPSSRVRSDPDGSNNDEFWM